MMRNILLRLSYDGTNFHGWQQQKTGERSVEEVIVKAWKKIYKGEQIKLITSGRTDKGVHALEQAACFKTENNIPPEGIKKALNGWLPDDVRIISATVVNDDFNARYSARGRTYIYKISKTYSLFDRNYSYYYPYPLNLEKMKEASRHLIGEHDFSAFQSSQCFSPTPVRNMKKITISEDEKYFYFEFTANAFLYRMIRTLIGTLITIGNSNTPPQEMKTILKSKNRSTAGKTAPPQGLYLKKIKYKDY